MNAEFIFYCLIFSLVFLQTAAIVIHGAILLKYRSICKHCDWWWDLGAMVFFIITFVPVLGILMCMIGPVDYIINIEETLKERYL